MSYSIEGCTLEVDTDRGVIYVHSPEGFTALRICGAPTGAFKPDQLRMLDITLKYQTWKPFTFNWGPFHPSNHVYTLHKTYTGPHCARCGQPEPGHKVDVPRAEKHEA